MDSSREIHVMRKFKPYLHCLQAYNRANFQHNTSEAKLKNVLFAAFVTFNSIMFALMPCMCTWCMYDDKFALSMIVSLLPIFTSSIQIMLTMVALLSKNQLISQVLDHLYGIVEKREFLADQDI